MSNSDHYWKTTEYQKHFNTIQAGIRAIASTWLLAVVAGIGILIKPEKGGAGEITNWFMPPHQMIISICLLGSAGMFLLWTLDQRIYQKLVGAAFLVGLQYEHRDFSLPPVHLMMVERLTKGATIRASLLYSTATGIFTILSIVVFILGLLNSDTIHQKIIITYYLPWPLPILFVLVQTLICTNIIWYSKNLGTRSSKSAMGASFSEIYSNKWYRHFLIQRYTLGPDPGESAQRPFRIVFTGGAHSGKTTMVTRLSAELQQPYIPESALQVINESIVENGIEPTTEWRKANQIEFQTAVAKRQLYLESKGSIGRQDELLLLDRGVFDSFAYLYLNDTYPSEELWLLAKNTFYGLVLVLETVTPFDLRSQTGRTSTEERSRAAGQMLHKVYESLGFKTIWVPQMNTFEQRIEFIKELIYKYKINQKPQGSLGDN